MKNKSKVLFASLVFLGLIVLSTNIIYSNSEEPPEKDPHDPGNSPGPGQLPPDSHDVIVPIQFIFEESELSLGLLNNHIL